MFLEADFEENIRYQYYLLVKRINKLEIICAFIGLFYLIAWGGIFVYLILYAFDHFTHFIRFKDIDENFWIVSVMLWLTIIFELRRKYANEELSYQVPKKDKLESWRKELNKLNEIINKNEDFILYLRDFAGGKYSNSKIPDYVSSMPSGIPSIFSWKPIFGKESTERVFRYFRRDYPIVCLYNQREKVAFPDTTILLYPSDEFWFSIFSRILPFPKFIIIDVAGEFTESVKLEVQTIMAVSRKNIIYSGYKSDLNSFISQFPEVREKIVYFFDLKSEEMTPFE
jgi:hypothetical protein